MNRTKSESGPAGARPVRVAIAGASGYVGRSLIEALQSDHRVIALSRKEAPVSDLPADSVGTEWRSCDLFSQRAIKGALDGADVAVYLVHSMLPSARLMQASFQDLDLILADNFARAAAKAGVKKILYLGGILPNTESLSAHLRSRLEVEQALGSTGVPVIALRAGLIVGPRGSSFLILQRLVERLPAMILAAWTKSRTQPICLGDVIQLLRLTIMHHEPVSANYDIAGPDVLTYKEMIADVAEALGRRSPLVPVPWFSPKLSCLWVSLVSGQSYALVSPLIESLLHEMLPRDTRLMDRFGMKPTPWRTALEKALRPAAQPQARAPRPENARGGAEVSEGRVRSVQRLPRPSGASAAQVAEEYMRWLPRALYPLVKVHVDGSNVEFRLLRSSKPALSLQLSRSGSHAERRLFLVRGGSLADATGAVGRLEFRITPDRNYVLAAIHEYKPRLPWYVYRATQAWVHLWVMRAFGRHLGRTHVLEPEATGQQVESA